MSSAPAIVATMLIGAVGLFGCQEQPLVSTTGAGGSAPPSTTTPMSTPDVPGETTTSTSDDDTVSPAVDGQSPVVAEQSPAACLPGTWAARMPELVAGFPVEGQAKYLDGTYTFTFDEDNTYSAEYSNVSFRIGSSEEFVDVYNSWEESGSWIGGLTDDQWNAAIDTLSLDTSKLKLTNLDMTEGLLSAFLVEDPRVMVLIAGSSFTQLEAYGMVQGEFRTPPLSDEGSALIAIGTVDCEAGVLQVDTLLDNWAPLVYLDRVD